jgi:hypothetical protein
MIIRKFLIIFSISALLSVSFLAADAHARRRHGGGFGVGLSLLFLLPLYSGHFGHNHDHHYGHDHYEGHYYPPRSVFLDESDRVILSEKTHYTLEKMRSGLAVRWRNPATGIEGSVVARPAFKNAAGQFCRKYEQTLRDGRLTRSGYDTACRMPDGRWENAPQF